MVKTISVFQSNQLLEPLYSICVRITDPKFMTYKKTSPKIIEKGKNMFLIKKNWMKKMMTRIICHSPITHDLFEFFYCCLV